MKYNEFEELMRDKGFEVENNRYEILVCDDGTIVSSVSKIKTLVMNTNYTSFMGLDYNLSWYVAKMSIELAFTDLEDREEEEEKCYYRLKGFTTSRDNYLGQGKTSQKIYLVSVNNEKHIKTQFTDAEFEALPDVIKSHNWEKIKVESEEQ